MQNTHIQWTHHTFNGWIGCTKISSGCLHCYAEAMAKRMGQKVWGKGIPRYRTSKNYWKQPIRWNETAIDTGSHTRVFCSSMADVFDAEVPPRWQEDLWRLIARCNSLDWQLLTKRPQNIVEMLPPGWGTGWDHVWLGTSVEDQQSALSRIPILRDIPARVRFLSVEPLLGPVELDLDGISWVICGGESGAGFRHMNPAWARSVRDQCIAKGVAFFFKQWSGLRPTKLGRQLDGWEWNEFPLPER